MRFLLNAVRRNLEFINVLQQQTDSDVGAATEQIRVIRMVHDQQREMLDRKSHRIDRRIVSLHQPHVRPIVRGKAGRETEFGAN